MRRQVVVIAVAAAVVVLLGAILLPVLRDARMPRERAERALEARLQDGRRYTCRQMEDDGSLGYDIDYFCEPVADRNGRGYWVATSNDRITSAQPTGP